MAKKFNRIQYAQDTPAQAESAKMAKAVPRTRANKRRDLPSNGSVAAPIRGRKLSGGANVQGGSL